MTNLADGNAKHSWCDRWDDNIGFTEKLSGDEWYALIIYERPPKLRADEQGRVLISKDETVWNDVPKGEGIVIAVTVKDASKCVVVEAEPLIEEIGGRICGLCNGKGGNCPLCKGTGKGV